MADVLWVVGAASEITIGRVEVAKRTPKTIVAARASWATGYRTHMPIDGSFRFFTDEREARSTAATLRREKANVLRALADEADDWAARVEAGETPDCLGFRPMRRAPTVTP